MNYDVDQEKQRSHNIALLKLKQFQQGLETLIECHWKTLSKDPGSTTFEDLEDNKLLYRCKYNCDGLDVHCDRYVAIKEGTLITYEDYK